MFYTQLDVELAKYMRRPFAFRRRAKKLLNMK